MKKIFNFLLKRPELITAIASKIGTGKRKKFKQFEARLKDLEKEVDELSKIYKDMISPKKNSDN